MFKKCLIFALVLFTFSCLFNTVSAEDKKHFIYENESKILFDILPNSGTPEYNPPDFNALVNRQTGINAVLKLFNLTEQAQSMSESEVENILSKYNDNKLVSAWARKSIAYALKNHLVSGTKLNEISPNGSFEGKMFSALALKIMGYTLNKKEYRIATAVLSEKGGLTVRQAVYFNDRNLTMDYLIGMLYGSLKAARSDGKSVIQKLVEDGLVNQDNAKKYGLIK